MAYAMRTGRMDQPLVLQPLSESKDSDGAVTQSWSAGNVSVMAEIMPPPSGTEQFAAAAVTARIGPTFRIWYRADVQAKWRALWTPPGGSQVTMEILSVVPVFGVGARCVLLQCGYMQ